MSDGPNALVSGPHGLSHENHQLRPQVPYLPLLLWLWLWLWLLWLLLLLLLLLVLYYTSFQHFSFHSHALTFPLTPSLCRPCSFPSSHHHHQCGRSDQTQLHPIPSHPSFPFHLPLTPSPSRPCSFISSSQHHDTIITSVADLTRHNLMYAQDMLR